MSKSEPFQNTTIGFLEPSDLETTKDGETIVKISKENPDTLYLLIAYANWCGPCQMTKPVYAELSRFLDDNKMDKIRLLAINTTGELPSEKDWARIAKEKLGVTGYPTILVVCKGSVIGKHEKSRDLPGFLATLLTYRDKHSHGAQLEHFKQVSSRQ
jgi:thiol-disulfide isomerase/thioredoxin